MARYTKVKELMKENPVVINPDSTLKEAAEKMRDIECGVLPVGS
jgi:CBS domain-containing protein